MPWMKVLRKPRLNSKVVSVAVDTAANFSRPLALSDMAAPLLQADVCAPPAGCQFLSPNVSTCIRAPKLRSVCDGAARWRRLTSYSRDRSPKPTIGSWFPSSLNPTRVTSPSACAGATRRSGRTRGRPARGLERPLSLALRQGGVCLFEPANGAVGIEGSFQQRLRIPLAPVRGIEEITAVHVNRPGEARNRVGHGMDDVVSERFDIPLAKRLGTGRLHPASAARDPAPEDIVL